MSELNDCEDQGYSKPSDGCQNCWLYPKDAPQERPKLVKKLRYGNEWWCCPVCGGSYGKVDNEPQSLNPQDKRES